MNPAMRRNLKLREHQTEKPEEDEVYSADKSTCKA